MVTTDQIANQLLSNGRSVEHRRLPGEHHKTIVPSNNQPPTELTKPFSLDELATGLSLLKPRKAAGLDYLLTEMLQHLDNKAKYWLLDMLNECRPTRTKHIQSIWRKVTGAAFVYLSAAYDTVQHRVPEPDKSTLNVQSTSTFHNKST